MHSPVPDLKREALATADALLAEHSAWVNADDRERLRYLLALAWVEGWGTAGDQAKAIVHDLFMAAL